MGESQVLETRLRKALEREGVDLERFAAIVGGTAPEDIEAIVRRRPAGVFARRLWFLYEWLTGRKLDVPEPAGRLRFVPVLDPARQVALKVGTPSGRHRVIDNLPGTPRFCPTIRWTPALRTAAAIPWDLRVRRTIAIVRPDHRADAAVRLQRSEAKASFVLAGEEPSGVRLARWADAIGEAGARVLSSAELARLQRIACGPSPRLGFRGGEESDNLVGGLIDFAERAVSAGVDPAIAAAALAFGFRRARPLASGVGRLHRW